MATIMMMMIAMMIFEGFNAFMHVRFLCDADLE